MDIDSESKTPTNFIFRGTFSIAIICLLTVIPYHSTYKPIVGFNISSNTEVLRIVQKKPLLPRAPQPDNMEFEQDFDPIIIEAANRYKIDSALVKAIIMVESNYDPRAISKKGAVGLMQIMPATALDFGVTDLFDPELNINTGVRYLKRLLRQFDGDISLALAAYNAGSSKVREYEGIPPFKVTQYYVKKVFEYYEYYQNMRITAGNAI